MSIYEEEFLPQTPPQIDLTADESADIMSRRAAQIGEWLGGGWIEGLFDAALEFVEDGLETLERIVGQIIDIFNGLVITPINDLIQGVKDWWHNLINWRGSTDSTAEAQQSQIIDQQGRLILTEAEAAAATQAAFDASTLAAVSEGLAIAADARIDNLNSTLATKIEFADIPTDVPGWYSLNPVDDVAFPRADLIKIPSIVNADTSNEFAAEFGPHTHKHNATLTWVDPLYTPTVNHIDFIYINTTRRRIYNTLSFAVGPKPSGTAAAFYAAVYKMDTDANGLENGNITRKWASSNVAATLPASGDASVEFPDLAAEPGDWHVVALVQGSGVIRPLFYKNAAGLPPISGFNPAKASMTNTASGGALSTSYAKGALDTATTIVPWAALGQKTALVLESWSDLFDRTNADALGVDWSVFGVGIVIRGFAAQSKQVDYGAFKSRENYSTAAYTKPTVTRSQGTSIQVGSWSDYSGNSSISSKPYTTMVWSRGNTDLTRGVAVMIYPNRVEIRGFNAANPRNTSDPAAIGGLLLAEVAHTAGTGNNTWYLHATGVAGTYVLYKNGETPDVHNVLSWSDSETNPQYATNRNDKYGGISVYCYSHGNLLPTNGQYISAPVKEWKLRDLTV